MKAIKRDKFGRFLTKTRKSRKTTSRPKRDAFGRFIGDSSLESSIDEVVRAEKRQAKKGVTKKPAKAAPKKPAKAVPKKPAKVVPKKPAKVAPKKPAKAVPKKPTKAVPRGPAKVSPKKPAKVVSKKSAKVAPKKPAKVVSKKPAKAAPKKPAKVVPKKPAKVAPRKPIRKKPAKPPKKVAVRPKKPVRPVRKKKPKKHPKLPPIDQRSKAAEVEIQKRLISLMETIATLELGLSMGIQSFINADGTVDGELRIANLPPEWRDQAGLAELTATLSSAFLTFRVFDGHPPMGGSFWFSVAVRFGPQNEAEMSELADLYKKNKGLFQIGTYPTRADHATPLQLCLTDDRQGLRGMMEALAVKRGLPPTAVLIRFMWGPDWSPERGGIRPGHYIGEKGKQ